MKHCIGVHRMKRDEFVRMVARGVRLLPDYYWERRPSFAPICEEGLWLQPKAAHVFKEPSSRTEGSGCEAAERYGFRNGRTLRSDTSSIKKNESLTRTAVTLFEQKHRALFIRTTEEGPALQIALHLQRKKEKYPWWFQQAVLINSGDGRKNHPTQVVLDVVALIAYRLGCTAYNDPGLNHLEARLSQMDDAELAEFIAATLNKLRIAFIGDLRNSRVVNSWIDLGSMFDIEFLFVAPPQFQVVAWRTEGIHASVTESLTDALDVDVAYTIRTQLERLEKVMSIADAEQALESLIVGREFLNHCRCVVFDAQPLDAERPMIRPDVWDHPKVMMDLQAGCGVPARIAVLEECWTHRHESIDLLAISPIEPQVVAAESIADHFRRMKEKWALQQRSVNPITAGMVLDRIPAGKGNAVYELLERARVFASDAAGGTIAYRKESKTLRFKDIIFLDDTFVPSEVLAALMLMAPQMVVIKLKDGQYEKLLFPLPDAVSQILTCPNTACITRVDPEAISHFRLEVHDGDSRPDIHLHCSFCRDRFSPKQIIRSLRPKK